MSTRASHAATATLTTPPGTFFDEAIIVSGRRAIAHEAAALQLLAESLGPSFAAAVETVLQAAGHVVVAGLGKSGQVARKIASTLAATGTPAHFLHAGDALHGDLGTLAAGDALLILSRSGATRECTTIAQHARSLGIAVVAITARSESALAICADHLVLLPDFAEACPFNMSPTASTTMMLALGDALAIAVMDRRAVTRDALRSLHPGGGLGRGLIPLDALMHRDEELPLVTPDMAMTQVVDVISAKGFGIAAVVGAEDRLLGIITDGDIRRNAGALSRATAGEVMSCEPRTLPQDAIAADALALLAERRITALLVVDDGPSRQVIGLVHVHDLLALGAA